MPLFGGTTEDHQDARPPATEGTHALLAVLEQAGSAFVLVADCGVETAGAAVAKGLGGTFGPSDLDIAWEAWCRPRYGDPFHVNLFKLGTAGGRRSAVLFFADEGTESNLLAHLMLSRPDREIEKATQGSLVGVRRGQLLDMNRFYKKRKFVEVGPARTTRFGNAVAVLPPVSH